MRSSDFVGRLKDYSRLTFTGVTLCDNLDQLSNFSKLIASDVIFFSDLAKDNYTGKELDFVLEAIKIIGLHLLDTVAEKSRRIYRDF